MQHVLPTTVTTLILLGEENYFVKLLILLFLSVKSKCCPSTLFSNTICVRHLVWRSCFTSVLNKINIFNFVYYTSFEGKLKIRYEVSTFPEFSLFVFSVT
jgi:hypothetical protein